MSWRQDRDRITRERFLAGELALLNKQMEEDEDLEAVEDLSSTDQAES